MVVLLQRLKATAKCIMMGIGWMLPTYMVQTAFCVGCRSLSHDVCSITTSALNGMYHLITTWNAVV